MTEAVVTSLVFAWLFRGYKWSQIFKLFKHWSFYPIILTCILQIYIFILMTQGNYWFMEYAKYIKIVSISFYFCLVWEYKLFDISFLHNINVKDSPILTTITSPIALGALFIGLGSSLNVIAMKFNNSKMPVFPSVSFSSGYSKLDMFTNMQKYGDFHIFGDYNTNLIFLTDTIDIFISIMSIGDILVRLFAGIVIYYSLKICSQNNI